MKLPPVGIRRIFPQRIWQQIFFILFFLVIIPIGSLGFFLLQTSQKAVVTTVGRDHKEIAVHATGEIKEHIKGAREALFLTASILGTLHADPWRQETTIVELSLRNPAFQNISSLNLEGEEIATSKLGTVLQNRAEEKAFQEAILGKPYLSVVKISENHIPFLTIAEPIRQLGEVKGVLVADLSLRSVWDIVDSMQIGQFGRAYLIDQQGRIIADQDKKLVLKNASLKQIQVIQDVLAGQTGNFEEVEENGELWLTSYAPIEQLNWGLIITQPQGEAYAISRTMGTQFLGIIVFAILSTLLLSLVLAHYMSRPMKDIIEGTERIAKGDFSHSFRIHGKSEIDKLLFSFNRMAHKLRKVQEDEKLSIIGKAATAIAHELKNSLQLVDTFVKELPQRHTDEKFIKEFSDTMPQELDSWNTSLKNMMTFSKNSQFSMKELDINEVIRKTLLLVKLKSRQLDVQLNIELEDNLPLIMGNEEKLKQVLLNIITNAFDATPSGGHISIMTRSCSLSAQCPEDHRSVEVKITNTGKGIAEDEVKKIFQPFYSTKNGGLGIGLSISREIVEHHHGKISVMSEKNKTTSFLVVIPASSVLLTKGTSTDYRAI